MSIRKDTGFSLWIATSDSNYDYSKNSAFQNILHFIKKPTLERDILMERGDLRVVFGFLKVSPNQWIRHGMFYFQHQDQELWMDPSHPELDDFEFVSLKTFTIEEYRATLSERFQLNNRCDLGLGEEYVELLMAFKEAAKLQGEEFLPTKLTPQLMEPLLRQNSLVSQN